ncbi:unnamed protein product [Brugia timori]|uniref:Ovule protein n=1 Tax=Brugia timori TaxID=42155 RepID=A0A0R3QBH4_9BILA|nr:unnamed protein product [Brugia timori]
MQLPDRYIWKPLNVTSVLTIEMYSVPPHKVVLKVIAAHFSIMHDFVLLFLAIYQHDYAYCPQDGKIVHKLIPNIVYPQLGVAE